MFKCFLSILLAGALLPTGGVFAQNIIPGSETRRPAKRQPIKKAVPTKFSTPRLIVTLVVDQFPARVFEKVENRVPEFAPFLKSAAVFENARYGHAATYTGPGHTVIATGRYAESHGITANKWFNRAKSRSEAILYDATAQVFENPEPTIEDETSGRNLIGDTVGDLWLMKHPESRVVSVALKERAAIAMAGHKGMAYWFNEGNGRFTSSRAYATALPEWVNGFNAGKPADRFYGATWNEPTVPGLFDGCQPDDFKFETDLKILGRTFPHTLKDPITDAPGKDYYEALTMTPSGIDLTFEFVRQAVEKEQLGRRTDAKGKPITDFLYVSITPTDLVGHAYGADSHESVAITFAALTKIGEFVKWLDGNFKTAETTVVLTGDHGSASLPEWLAANGEKAFRIKKKTVKEAIEKRLTEKFGKPAGGKWVTALEDPSIFFDETSVKAALAAVGPEGRLRLEREAGEACKEIPGVGFYVTRTRLLALREGTSGKPTPEEAMTLRSFHPDRSGDLLIFMAPGSIWGKYAEKDAGTTHGSPNDYDRHVPLLIRSPRYAAGPHPETVDMASVGPTVGQMVGIYPRDAAAQPIPGYKPKGKSR
jgi:predicted AlkP superfamily pyrophosphatase or phosphodiesterase